MDALASVTLKIKYRTLFVVCMSVYVALVRTSTFRLFTVFESDNVISSYGSYNETTYLKQPLIPNIHKSKKNTG